ncbi:hypothetical protein C8R46DRAFT_1224842 [Mycena filopes]|nr:hypothetical protein C8R46DRAFT_1224842 [Mycena filopes]
MVAIYIGFPLHSNPARHNFLEPIHIGLSSPSVGDLIQALRSTSGSAGETVNDICADLDMVVFDVAWSKSMIEVHDAHYNTVANGYQEVGALRPHLHDIRVTVEMASPNDTSIRAFQTHNLAANTPLFVLYLFPLHVQTMPAGPSRTQTPTPSTITIRAGLSNMLRKSSALDVLFSLEGFQLAALLTPNFGTAYLQIRQALIIEDVCVQGTGLIPQLTSADVSAWAGLKLNTYSNNLTFAL